MMSPFVRIPIFVSLLDAFPIRVADGLVLLESDVTECLVVQVFGQRMTLPVTMNDGSAEIAFEGAMTGALVEIPNVCSISVPRIRFGIQSPTSSLSIDSLVVDVLGHARVELHLPGLFGNKTLLVEGKLHIATKNGLAIKHVRIDFEQAAWSLPLPGGVSLCIQPKFLDFSSADDGSARVEMLVACSVEGLAPRMRLALGKAAFEAHLRWTKDGTTLAATTVWEGIKIPLPTFDAFGGGAKWALDEMTLSAKYLRINIGSSVECSIDVRVGVPMVLHEYIEPHIDLRLSAINDEVHIELLSSPFRNLDCTRVPNGNLRARMPVGQGQVTFDLPILCIDWARRCIVAEGRIAHRNLHIPLAPLRSLFERTGLDALAKHLPNSIALQSFGLSGIAATFSDLITAGLQNGFLTEHARHAFDSAFKALYQLPPRLQKDFLDVHVPKELAYRFECTFDFDARLHLAPSNDPIRAQTSPIRLLVPLLGPHGPELLGITLYRWAFGELRAGQVFTVEVDAEIENFDLMPFSIVSASRNTKQWRLVLRDVVALLGQTGGVPWLVPTSFRKIAWNYSGADGTSAIVQCDLSLPKADFSTLLHWLLRRCDGSTLAADTIKDPQFECHVGPAYFRLPRSMGGKEFGSMDEMISLRTQEELDRLLQVWQKLDVDGFLEMLSAALSRRDLEENGGADYRKAMRAWSSVITPFLAHLRGG